MKKFLVISFLLTSMCVYATTEQEVKNKFAKSNAEIQKYINNMYNKPSKDAKSKMENLYNENVETLKSETLNSSLCNATQLAEFYWKNSTGEAEEDFNKKIADAWKDVSIYHYGNMAKLNGLMYYECFSKGILNDLKGDEDLKEKVAKTVVEKLNNLSKGNKNIAEAIKKCGFVYRPSEETSKFLGNKKIEINENIYHVALSTMNDMFWYLKNFESSSLYKDLKQDIAEKTKFKTVGLANIIGKTCYFNTAMQALCASPKFKNFVKENSGKSELAKTLYDLFTKMETSKAVLDSTTMNIFWDNIAGRFVESYFDNNKTKKERPLFIKSEQHDSTELLGSILDKLQERSDVWGIHMQPVIESMDGQKKNKPKVESISLFNLSMINAIINQIAKEKGENKDELLASVYSRTIKIDTNKTVLLEQLINTALEPEDIEFSFNDDGNREQAVKKKAIWKLPPILFIKLVREEAYGLTTGGKLGNPVVYPEEITLQELSSAGNETQKDEKKPEYCDVNYQLVAVINHSGVQEGGHYFAYVKGRDGTWHEQNDSNSYNITLFGSDGTVTANTINGYSPRKSVVGLIYERVD